MPLKLQEALAIVTVVGILIGVPVAIWHYEFAHHVGGFGDDAQVFTLTGSAPGGTWTVAAAAPAGDQRLPFPGQPVLRVDPRRPVVLRLRSSDVLHSFSIADLSIGPVDVYPGRETVVRLEPEDLRSVAELQFRCVHVCGRDHKYMSGWILNGASTGVEQGVPRGDGAQ